ncbi:hypothetical protein H0O02_02185 [Candidatus Micrarchaeota archaeon]|nr:hypothetical protein [Candidatus Micrarchaeota archaeon]
MDWLTGEKKAEEGKREITGGRILAKPFNISMSFTPLRLSANQKNSVNLVVKLTNLTKDPQLVSVDVLLPKEALIGFEPTCINKAMEKRLGEVRPGETARAAIPIWASTQTRPGVHGIAVNAYAHYIGYEKVLNYMKTKTSLRIV